MISESTRFKWDEMILDIKNSKVINLTEFEVKFINDLYNLRFNDEDISFRQSKTLREIYHKLSNKKEQ